MTFPEIYFGAYSAKIMGVAIVVPSLLDVTTFKNSDINLFQVKQAYNL